MIDIYLISGFLGAGKTTLIQKMLNEDFAGQKVALIENDFGKVSFDTTLLRSSGVEVKEINSGCICCTLFGDFVQAIISLGQITDLDAIIIEPSGVGKLSDIIRACSEPEIKEFAQIKARIAVVDIKRYPMYLANFSEFYEDQIINADAIVLSRTEQYPQLIDAAFEAMTKINRKAYIFSRPWDEISSADILETARSISGIADKADQLFVPHTDSEGNRLTIDHDHAADEVFESITIRPKISFSSADLADRLANLTKSGQGMILRAKGILPSTDGHLIIQYLPGETKITPSSIKDNSITIIGANLDRKEVLKAFYQ